MFNYFNDSILLNHRLIIVELSNSLKLSIQLIYRKYIVNRCLYIYFLIHFEEKRIFYI